MGRRSTRLPLAFGLAAAAAGAATLILLPRSGLIDPEPVDLQAYFTPEQIEHAEAFRGPQRLLGVGGLLVGAGALALLAWRPPRRLLDPLARRPILGGAAAGAGISLFLTAVELPLGAVRHQRAFDVGLSTQSWGEWLADVARSAGIGAVTAAVGGALALALVRRFRRNWWAPAAVCVIAFGVFTTWLYPVVIDPIFNRFDPLPRGELRADVLRLADRAGVDVGEVYRVDASRRTTAANAYVNGLGPTKRVVLYDNLIEDFPEAEVRSVVAHELGHQHYHDLIKGLAWLALVAPAGTFLAQRLAEAIGRRQGLGDPAVEPVPIVLPAIALSVTVVSFLLGSASNVLSRQVEARADAFSIELTRDPGAAVALQRRLDLQNVSDPDPPGIYQTLFGTHPTTAERIGIGRAWEDERR